MGALMASGHSYLMPRHSRLYQDLLCTEIQKLKIQGRNQKIATKKKVRLLRHRSIAQCAWIWRFFTELQWSISWLMMTVLDRRHVSFLFTFFFGQKQYVLIFFLFLIWIRIDALNWNWKHWNSIRVAIKCAQTLRGLENHHFYRIVAWLGLG